MDRKFNLILICAIFFVCGISAKTKCVKAKGKLECKKDRSKQMDVEIYLMDRDTIGPDDTMGYTMSNEDGSFKIEGCGYDFLENEPDPYLKIWSYCGTYTGRRIDTDVRQIFTPEELDFGVLSLD